MKILNYITSLYLYLFFFCSSCANINHQEEYEDRVGFEIISINIDDREDFLMNSDFMKSVDFIRLETNENCLIGKIDKIEIDNKYIYILDKNIAKSLFVFTKDGEFVTKVGTSGRGPGEYISVADFRVLDEGKLLIYDFSNDNILFYDNFEFTHNIKIPFIIQSITEDNSLYYIRPLKFDHRNTHDLLIANSNLKIINKEFPIPSKTLDLLGNVYDFRDYKDSITFIDKFKNKVYRLKGEKVIPKYYFDFQDNQITYEIANFGQSDDLNLNNMAYLGTDYFESDRFLIFGFSFKGKGHTAVYDKKNKKLRHSKGFGRFVCKGNTSVYVNSDENSVFGYLESSNVHYLDEETRNKYGLSHDFKNTDNPIISVSHFIKE